MPDEQRVSASKAAIGDRMQRMFGKAWRKLIAVGGFLILIAWRALSDNKEFNRALVDGDPKKLLHLIGVALALAAVGGIALFAFIRFLEGLEYAWNHYPTCKSKSLFMRLVYATGKLLFGFVLVYCLVGVPVGLVFAMLWLLG